MLAKGDERYADASKRLRKQLGDGKAYEEANAWALKLCREAEQYDWPSRPQPKQTLDAGKSAAKLADYLDSIGKWGMQQYMQAAEEQSGIKLSLDAATLAKYLRALAEQIAADSKEQWLPCGPLLIRFTDKNQIKMPAKSHVTALAVALMYGFRKIPNCVKNNKPFKPQWGDRLVGGEPCLPSAVDFANATFKEKTNVAAVKQWLKNNRGRFRFRGFDSKI